MLHSNYLCIMFLCTQVVFQSEYGQENIPVPPYSAITMGSEKFAIYNLKESCDTCGVYREFR